MANNNIFSFLKIKLDGEEHPYRPGGDLGHRHGRILPRVLGGIQNGQMVSVRDALYDY